MNEYGTAVKLPNSVTQNNNVTPNWDNLGSLGASGDNSWAYTSLTAGQSTAFIKCQDFNFKIPSTATITGVTVKLRTSMSGSGVTIPNLNLIKSNGSTGSENKGGTAVTAVWTEYTYGANDDLWGETLTPLDINDKEFGVILNYSATGAAFLYLDYLEVTVDYYFSPSTVIKEKEISYKVYDSGDKYITNWNDVVSDIQFNNEINSTGGQLQIILGRNAGDYGEGSDVDFNYRVKAFAYDKDEPNGTIVYDGVLSSYTPIYKNNNVAITLLSAGSEMNNFMLQEYAQIVQQNAPVGKGFLVGYNPLTTNYTETILTFTVGAGYTEILKIEAGYEGFGYTAEFELKRGSTVIATATKPSASGSLIADFITPVPVVTGETLTLDVTYEAATPLMHYAHYLDSSSGSTVYYIYAPDGTTEIAYNSYDPSNILKSVIDKYKALGGIVDYDQDSIDITGTTVSYTFKNNTTLEAVKKCLELAPENWYWYIDSATNLLHFHEKSSTPDHIFSLEKDIIDAKFEKRIEDIVNTVYFIGAEVAGENLFYKFENTNSVKKYGRKVLKYSDQRVTSQATASTISNNIIATKSEPELRVTLEILDNNNGDGLGYDIESIKIGDVVAVRNITQQVGLSSWDVSRWDESYWDFNIYNLSSLEMQVQKIDYKKDRAVVYASTIAVDVNKRIEDINRNLEVMQSANNPSIPT